MNAGPARKIEDFFKQYPLRRFKKGQILIYGGDEPGGVFYLVEGVVRKYDITKTGDEVVVNTFKPPDFFPMTWALDKIPNEYFFETVTAVALRRAPAAATVRFLQSNPDVAYGLLGQSYANVDNLLRRMAHLMGGTARTRTLFELIRAYDRFGEEKGKGCVVKIPEIALARQAGLSRETVSRELHKLQTKGLVTVAHGTIFTDDMSRLENELGSDI